MCINHVFSFRFFKEFVRPDFAKAGTIPTSNITIPVGPVQFPPAMLDQLRKLGLILEIEDGVLVLKDSFIVAQAGVPLNPEQAKVLQHLNQPIEEFRIKLECVWNNGKFEEL